MSVSIGGVFGRLLVVEDCGRTEKVRWWLCKCQCGNVKRVRHGQLTSGKTRSCGCLARQIQSESHRKHGLAKTPTWKSWVLMRSRCNNEKLAKWKHYGGRGITYCDRWDSFENFLADMGERPEGASLDRIDNDGPYSPENCRWATHRQQMNNTRITKRVTAFGKTQTLSEWEEETGIKKDTIRARIDAYGMSPEEAVSLGLRESQRGSTPWNKGMKLTNRKAL